MECKFFVLFWFLNKTYDKHVTDTLASWKKKNLLCIFASISNISTEQFKLCSYFIKAY